MELYNWGILLFLVLPAPLFLGLIPVKYMNASQRTPAMAYACGWFVSFFLFELTAIPFILLQKSFRMLVAIYTAVFGAAIVYSVLSGRRVFIDFIKNIKKIRTMPFLVIIGWLLVFGLIGAQMVYTVQFAYWDGDDAYYIATAVLTDTFDTMYLRDAYTGYIYPLDIRHALSPTPIYQAWLSRLSGIPPAAVAHTILAPVWLLFMYCIFGQIGNRLLYKNKDAKKNRRNYRPVFMLLIIVWFAYGNVSLYTAETFIMTRTWQGKGLMAGIVLPALFLCIMYLASDKVTKGVWLLFVCVIVSAVFATSISFMLVPTVVGLAAIMIALRKKDIKIAVLMMVCCLPCLVLGGCYLLIS